MFLINAQVWSHKLTKLSTFGQMKAEVKDTISNIAPVPFAEAVGAFEENFNEVLM